MKTYKVRCWNPETEKEYVDERDLDGMIASPEFVNINDLGLILLNRLREERGMKPISETAFNDDIPQNN